MLPHMLALELPQDQRVDRNSATNGFDKKNATLHKKHQCSSGEWGFNICFPENPVFPRKDAWAIRETLDDCYENFGLRKVWKKSKTEK